MKITKQNGPPEDLLYFDDEVSLTSEQVEDVVEIFNTPLTGAYNWDYTVADNRIKKLYELGKELNQMKNYPMKHLKPTKIFQRKKKYSLIGIQLQN
jgi:hypothetical protein